MIDILSRILAGTLLGRSGRLPRRSHQLFLRPQEPLILPCQKVIEPPAVGVLHHRRRDELTVLEVLIHLRLAPAVPRQEEDMPRVDSDIGLTASL